MTITETRPLNAKVWEREANEHYVEPHWCSARLFEQEKFEDSVWDPCCGFGRIPEAASKAGLAGIGTDIVSRGWSGQAGIYSFLDASTALAKNIVCNPPFNIAPQFAQHALSLDVDKVAMIFQTARLNAAHWIHGTPLAKVLFMTPRPSMPPGHTIARGEKPGGGKMDFCWLLWTRGRIGPATVHWLRRDA